MQSNQIICRPQDSRCRYWAKVVRASDALPMPADIDGANSVPGAYIRGDVEIFEGDYVLEGEENHHAKRRGWTYWLRTVDATGAIASVPFDTKAAIRASDADRALLLGSGDVAAMVRTIHWLRTRRVAA
jgi:hypothetical protein